MEQLELQGISLQYSASATKPEGVETVDMSGMMSQTLGDLQTTAGAPGFLLYTAENRSAFPTAFKKASSAEHITGVDTLICARRGRRAKRRVLQADL